MALASNARPSAVRLTLAAAGMIVGALVGWGTGRLIKHGALDLSGAGWSDLAAGTIAAMLLASGLIIGLATFNRRLAARLLDPAGQRPARPSPVILPP